MKKYKKASDDANAFVIDCLLESQDAKEEIRLSHAKHGKRLNYIIQGIFGLMLGLMFSFALTELVFASEPGAQVFTRANTAMQGVLRQIRIISSIIAALFLTIAFLMKMFSKNQRTVDEANTWIKRIIIAWACINAVGFILTFVQEIIGPDMALPTISG